MSRTAVFHPAPDLDTLHDPGFAEAAQRGASALTDVSGDRVGSPIRRGTASVGAHEIRVGTASWTDPTLVKGGVFYPRGVNSAANRLRYYTTQFPVVEVDSTYYSLPDPAIARLWAERTPDDFIFHVKAHALLTGQPTEVARLPAGLVAELPAAFAEKTRIYAKDLPRELYEAVWDYFLDALEPLRERGKLGAILLQYPRWFLPTRENKDHLSESAKRLAGVAGAVELRNGSWFSGDRATGWTLDLLRDLGLTYVMVDGPQGLESSVPPRAALTTPRLAVVRLHGRRTATWEAPNVPTVERYRYLYSSGELDEWVPRIEEVATEAALTVVLLNNCYGNYGTTNARELAAKLARDK